MWEVLVIGCNGITKKWLDALKGREDIVLVAFADPAVERAEALRAAYAPGAKVYDGADAALEDCKANLVLDATPPFVHHAVVMRALREGRCVLGEKPMADDLARAREMVACAQESGQPYFVMQNRRYLRGIQTLRAELAKTYLGKPYLVTCDMFLGAHFMGPGDGRPDFRNRIEHPILVDMLIHTFDQARFLLGEKRAVSAYCQELNPPNSWYDHPAIALCTFSFEDGSVLSLRGSWATKCENTTSHGFWRVYCTDGTACWDGAERVWVSRAQPVPSAGYFEEEGVREDIPLSYAGRENHVGCVEDMLSALNRGQTMMTDCRNNIHSLEMVYACIRSAETGRKCFLSPDAEVAAEK